jgi:hypothetical protein
MDQDWTGFNRKSGKPKPLKRRGTEEAEELRIAEIPVIARNLQKLAASSQELAAGCLVTITVYPITAFANY